MMDHDSDASFTALAQEAPDIWNNIAGWWDERYVRPGMRSAPRENPRGAPRKTDGALTSSRAPSTS